MCVYMREECTNMSLYIYICIYISLFFLEMSNPPGLKLAARMTGATWSTSLDQFLPGFLGGEGIREAVETERSVQ